jgi:hypothetical protein
MSDKKFLTPQELSERWGQRITVRTLANWKSAQMVPPFVKVGGAILYRITDVELWQTRNTVTSTSQYSAMSA